jgi:hypothetical protein
MLSYLINKVSLCIGDVSVSPVVCTRTAVDTFNQSYQTLAREMGVGAGGHRVEIDTLDGFITRNVLHPHAFRTMGAGQAAHLVTGAESFLGGYNFWNGTYPLNITQMQVGARGADIYFYYANNDQIVELDTYYASEIVRRLGRTGAYTHNWGAIGVIGPCRTSLSFCALLRAAIRTF